MFGGKRRQSRAGTDPVRPWRGWVAPAWIAVAVVGLTWPIGLGGRMPVGGDATRFSIGLMAVFDRALASWRLPTWNDLWGFGFPGIAESQMGVYYPPHWLLHGLFVTESAYAFSVLLHAAFGAFGAFWAARQFGASSRGSLLSGLAFAGSGFFAIHRSHPWALEVGSWMPWAWGLGWCLMCGRGGIRRVLGLSAVLAIQVLPGHFQLAFVTQVGLIVLTLAMMPGPGDRSAFWLWLRRNVAIVLAIAGAGLLSALQIVPTWRLANMAEGGRTLNYLSGFAAPPVHLLSYWVPALFHRSPLWRPIAWDPFHASPEEHLGYVGLAPLFLAFVAVGKGGRRDRGVRALAVVVVVSMLLSFGPYLPGFGLLSRVPGFGFFRAPARWGLATMLALAILAGLGLDRLPALVRPRRALLGFVAVAAAVPWVAIGIVELALSSTEGAGITAVADAFDAAGEIMPWEGDPDVRAVMASARAPIRDPLNAAEVRRRGLDPRSTFAAMRASIYLQELWPSELVLVGLLGASLLAGRERRFAVALIAVSAVDLVLLSRLLAPETAPIAPLRSLSPVLAALSERVPGGRSLDPFGNLVMAAGVAPLRAYRTLDLPALVPVVALAGSESPLSDRAARSLGVAAWVTELGPGLVPSGVQIVEDEALASWIYGPQWLASEPWRSRFGLRFAAEPPPSAFLTRANRSRLDGIKDPTDLVRTVLDVAESSPPVAFQQPSPDRIEIGPIRVGEEGGPNLLVISILHDPQWIGDWTGLDGDHVPAAPVRVFGAGPGSGGWIGAAVPGRGTWRLALRYDARAERIGLAISAAAWSTWLAAWAIAGFRRNWRRRRGDS